MAFPIAARFAHPGNGYDGDQKQAAKYLQPGKAYVLTGLEVGRSSSRLFLDIPNAPSHGFNTVMFEPASVYDVDGAIGPDDDEPESDDEGVSTVGDLADYLAGQPRDRKIILRKDAEGNGHSPLADAWEALYEPDSTYSGEVHPTSEDVAVWVASGAWSQADADDRYEPENAERVIVLGPVN
jgi:hypothetical protein